MDESALEDQSTSRPEWVAPEMDELSVEELVDLAEIKIAFANTNTSGDVA